MAEQLSGKRVAALVTNGFEQSELLKPRDALEGAGARVDVVSLKKDTVKGWDHKDWGDEFDVDLHIDEADPAAFDALLLPGGVMNPDYLRMDPRAVKFVQTFAQSGKPIAAICHGPWLLVEAEVVKGKRVTSYPSLRRDLQNAGASWVDESVVVDGNLITSRRPDDLDDFSRAMIDVITEGGAPRRSKESAPKMSSPRP